ncbi:hypothetical protein Z043_100945 [Scleropages formosus]|uniref:Uncharacterized protein n=1 Tax=Scleropages formosus TaxID=113540 RepID=A0A0P7UZ70_SCLFO|nr:hypothetical protein Z043_100945 [Scleropages formosus]
MLSIRAATRRAPPFREFRGGYEKSQVRASRTTIEAAKSDWKSDQKCLKSLSSLFLNYCTKPGHGAALPAYVTSYSSRTPRTPRGPFARRVPLSRRFKTRRAGREPSETCRNGKEKL